MRSLVEDSDKIQDPEKRMAALRSLRDRAVDWCLVNGVVMRASASPANAATAPIGAAAVKGTVVVHAPFALFPSEIPRQCYADAIELQPLFNYLVHAVATDDAFMTEVMEELSI